MATDPFLLDRIQQMLSQKGIVWEEKRMFGGHCFMVDDKMCLGTFRGGMMARVAPGEVQEFVSTKTGAEQMKMGERTMKGFIHIEAEGYDADKDLEFWIDKCLEYNPLAKSSKKKKRK